MYRFASVAVIVLIIVSACGTSEVSEPDVGGDASQIVIQVHLHRIGMFPYQGTVHPSMTGTIDVAS
jgi:hypothetical protein